MSNILFIIFAVLIGMLMPFQAGINSSLAKHLGSSVQAGFISFLGGTLLMMAACFFFRQGLPSLSQSFKAPPYLLIGGLLGAGMVLTSIIFAPRIGAVALISCFVTGQLLISVVLDHFGWLGFPHHPANFMRLLGVVFLFLGVFFVQKF